MFKILHVTQSLVGGPAAYLDEIAEHQISLLGKTAVRFYLPADQLDYCARIPRDCVSPFNTTSRDIKGILGFGFGLLKEIQEFQPDIIHLHCSLAGAVGRLLYPFYRSSSARVVYCPHGWSFSIRTAAHWQVMFAAAEFALSPLADRVVLISNNELSEAHRWRQPKHNLRVVRNGVTDLTQSGFSAENEAAIDSKQLNLLFVGRLDKQKGFDLLIDALARVDRDDICLHVVGSAFLNKNGAPVHDLPRVKHWGWQPREKVAQLYRFVDALVVPSRWEGFGLVAAEALRAGCPVIASNVGGLPELVVEGETGHLFEANSAEAIAQVLQSLDKNALRELRPAARRHYVQNFNAERLNRELVGVYQSVLIDRPVASTVSEQASR